MYIEHFSSIQYKKGKLRKHQMIWLYNYCLRVGNITCEGDTVYKENAIVPPLTLNKENALVLMKKTTMHEP